MARENSLPWLCIGDFNDLLSPEDKKGRVPHPNWLFTGFRDAILACNLSDIDLEGHKYTWCRSNGASEVVEERLDRAMGTPSWHAKYPNAKLKNLVAAVSDRNPIVLDTNPVIYHRRPRPFRFENKWIKEPDIQNVVDRSWSGFNDFSLLKRLQATGDILRTWGDHMTKAWLNNKKDLERDISSLQHNLTGENLIKYKAAKSALATLLFNEETYWK